MMRSQSGQVTVELVLISVVLLGLALFVQKQLFKDGEFLANLVEKPWMSIAGLIENGSLGTPDRTRILHPGHGARHLSVKGVPE